MTRPAAIAQAILLAGPLGRFLPRIAEDLHAAACTHPQAPADECGSCWMRAAVCLNTLGEIEPEHVIDLRDDGWTLRHPLICREVDLFGCALGQVITDQMRDGAPDERGRFIVTLSDEGFAVIGEQVPA